MHTLTQEHEELSPKTNEQKMQGVNQVTVHTDP